MSFKVTRKNTQTKETYTNIVTKSQLDNITRYPSTLYSLESIEPYEQPSQATEYKNLVNSAIQKVKNFTTTVVKKSYHETKLYELKNLYYELMEINRYLFSPDTFEFMQYKQNIDMKKPKKELDNNLKYCLFVIHRQLQEIKQKIENQNIKGLEYN